MRKFKNTPFVIENIRAYRNLRNYTQDYMASELDITQGAYSLYEANAARISVDTLLAIARILDISPMKLLVEEGKETVSSDPETGIDDKDKAVESMLQGTGKLLTSLTTICETWNNTINILTATIINADCKEYKISIGKGGIHLEPITNGSVEMHKSNKDHSIHI